MTMNPTLHGAPPLAAVLLPASGRPDLPNDGKLFPALYQRPPPEPKAAEVAPRDVPGPADHYQQTQILIARLHGQLLKVIGDELARQGEDAINNVQALLLFNVSSQVLTPGDLRRRGCYLGKNVSYSLKTLIASGYLDRERSTIDGRSVLIRLTAKGKKIRKILWDLFDRHTESLEAVANLGAPDLKDQNATLTGLARHLNDQISYHD
jgi:DNA-binding MarR family transcriptional regulator